MATYNLTAGNDVLTGTEGADTFVYNGAAGGTDTLDGGAGDDVFSIGFFGSGTINGGVGVDTVKSLNLGNALFTNVEVLDASWYGGVRAAVSQLNSFTSIINAENPGIAVTFRLVGNGGTIDFSTRMTDAGVYIYNYDVSAGYAITGTVNDDYLEGSGFDDTLNGGEGADTIVSSGGTDTLIGGAGNDTFELLPSGSGTIDGGTGTDMVSNGTEFGDLGTFTFSNVEILQVKYPVIATLAQLSSFAIIRDSYYPNSMISIGMRGDGGIIDFSTRFTGGQSLLLEDFGVTSGYNVTGTANGDRLTGSDFNDTLNGGGGSDRLDGGGGADKLAGGAGDDSYFVDNTGDSIIEGVGSGSDRVRTSISYALGAGAEVEFLVVSNEDGVNSINLTGNAFAQTIIGNAGANVINGLGGSDTMRGLGGNDIYYVDNAGDITVEEADGGTDTVRSYVNWTLGANVERLELQGTGNLNGTGNTVNNTLVGNAGNNLLNGGAGNDYMVGGAGNDIFVVGSAGDSTVESAGGGTDTVRSYVNWTLGANVERLELQGTGNLNGTGNTLNNTLVGNFGNNGLNGGDGNDYITAGAGNDTLSGGGGNDRLVGGAGRDVLNGGTGNDTFDFDFVYDSPAGPALRDSILGGFSHGFDGIDLATIDANTLVGGNQAFSFIGSAAFSGVAGQLRYSNYNGTVIIDADLNGDSTADMQILVAGTNFMTGTDFIV